jgi:hypothetical protein
MRRSIMKRFVWSGATFVSLVSALLAQGTWTWQKQCQQQQRVERNLLHLCRVWLRPEQQPCPPLFQQLGAFAVWRES